MLVGKVHVFAREKEERQNHVCAKTVDKRPGSLGVKANSTTADICGYIKQLNLAIRSRVSDWDGF